MSRSASGALACLALLLVATSGARAELRAERIREANASRLRIAGPDAVGGVGDWWLSNGVVEAVIDDVERAYGMLGHGGTLVDAGLADREGEDQLARLVPLVNLSQRVVVGYDAIRAEVDPEGAFARVVVTSPGLRTIPRGGWLARFLDPLVPHPEDVAAVRVETVYALHPDEDFVRITTTLTNTGERAAPVFAFGDVWMRGGRSGRGFLGHATAPALARAWDHRDMTPDIRRSLGALTRFTHASLVGAPEFPPIAYALVSPERAARGLPFLGFAGEHATLAFAFIGDPEVEEPGPWSLARALFRELPPRSSWRYERRLHVAGRRDLAATTDAVLGALGVPSGSGFAGEVSLGGRRAVLIVTTPSGVPVTQLSLDGPSGEPARFSASLPPGEYVAVLRAEHGHEQRVALSVREGLVAQVDLLDPPPLARLVFAPVFGDGGPGRVEVRGEDGSADPVFGDDLLGATRDGRPLASGTASSSLAFAGGAEPLEVAIAPGRYVLTATRGLDWEIAQVRVEVPADGARVSVPPFVLEPLAPLPGWVTADLHVHAEASDDSQVPNEERLRRYLAEGVAVLVATDHDQIADYGPALARLGVGDRLRVVHGVEVTNSAPSLAAPWTLGHHNAWPLQRRRHAHRGGAPPSQGLALGRLYAALRSEHGARVVQLNHPRPTPRDLAAGDVSGTFFAHGGDGRPFDPTRAIGDPVNEAFASATGEGGTRALDFDAIELMNGGSWEQYLAVRADWHALLRQGLRRTGTANSDTHAPDELAAYPRNYVYVGPDGDDALRFDAALRAGRSFGTTGPRIVRLRANGAAPGELAAAEQGRVRIEYAVDAASWVPVDEVRVLLDGRVVRAGPERSGAFDLQLERDAFVTLEAGAPLDAEPAAWISAHPGPYTEVLAPGFVAAAFANPVFVDVDGNGAFDAPGL